MKRIQCCLVVVVLLALTSRTRADGLIIIPNPPTPTPGHFHFAPLEVVYHHVEVQIENGVAATEVDQAFYNPSSARLEGEYMFPLPDGAAIDNFSMDVNGKQIQAELLPADKARDIYEDIVRKQRDPALLEYTGRGALRARIFPIEPHSKKQVKLRYTQLIKPDSGLSEYVYPLNTEKFSAKPLKDVSITIDIACDERITTVYSPTHDIEVKHRDDTHVRVSFEARDTRPDTDFKLVFAADGRAVGMSVLTYRPDPEEDGYFMLLASPGAAADESTIQERDICFVVDTSGSMAGAKLKQTKKALQFCLENLNKGDRFQIVRFSTEAESLFDQLVAADEAHLKEAHEYVESFKPIGGTAIAEALGVARRLGNEQTRDDDRPYVIIFLTDGQPTVGETSEDAIAAAQIKSQRTSPRIFSFGIGSDVNTHLLDRISNDTRAFSQYVADEEDIEVKVSTFYTKIKSPVLTGLKLEYADRIDHTAKVDLRHIYPPQLPDLYAGQTLVVFGRYRGHGHNGRVFLQSETPLDEHIAAKVDFPERDDTHAFIARLWATRRVGWLLDEIRMNGESEELKDEVVTLAREHGIVTPYTAYLILEDEAQREVPMTLRSFRDLEEDELSVSRTRDYYESAQFDSGRLEKAGDRAVANAEATQALKQNASAAGTQIDLGLAKSPTVAGQPLAATTQPGDALGYKVQQNFTQQVRNVRGKTFYQNGARWTDSEAQAKTAKHPRLIQKQVEFNSDEYFAFLRDHPAAAPWLSLGNEMDLVIGETLYQIR